MQKWEYLALRSDYYGWMELNKKRLGEYIKVDRKSKKYGLEDGWFWSDYIDQSEKEALSSEFTSKKELAEFLNRVKKEILGIDDRLSLLGAEGWELVSTYTIRDDERDRRFYSVHYIFKRPLED